MDNPKFIQFSVNKEGTLLAVEPYHRKTFTSFAIPRNLYSYNGAMVVYSKSLCSLIYNRLNWNKDKLYRIPGEILKEEKAAVFNLMNAVCYDGNLSDKELEGESLWYLQNRFHSFAKIISLPFLYGKRNGFNWREDLLMRRRSF